MRQRIKPHVNIRVGDGRVRVGGGDKYAVYARIPGKKHIAELIANHY